MNELLSTLQALMDRLTEPPMLGEAAAVLSSILGSSTTAGTFHACGRCIMPLVGHAFPTLRREAAQHLYMALQMVECGTWSDAESGSAESFQQRVLDATDLLASISWYVIAAAQMCCSY